MKQKKSRISVKISLYIAIMQVLVMFFLFLYISISVTGNMKQTAIDTMQTISADRAKIIEDYILSSEGGGDRRPAARPGRPESCRRRTGVHGNIQCGQRISRRYLYM